MAAEAQFEGRSTDDLIKGYWDNRRNTHVKGLWEQVQDLKYTIRYMPYALGLVAALELAILAKNSDPGAIIQIVSEFFKLL